MTNDLVEITSSASSEPDSLRRLRGVALLALAVGALGSLVLMLRAGRHSPRLLLVLFTFWMLSPFVVLVLAHFVSRHWSVLTRATLYIVMLVIALGSLIVYGDDALGHRRPQAAFVYVAVPPLSWLLMVIVVPIAALVSRRHSRRLI